VIKNKRLFIRSGIAGLSLAAAIGVYLFARTLPPEILAPWQSTDPRLAGHIALFGSAPSLFYTLALGLVIGACASTANSARWHCLAWTGLASLLEISQFPGIAMPVSKFVHDVSPESVWHLVGPYWTRGVFDPLDLLATLIGGFIALLLLGCLPDENTD